MTSRLRKELSRTDPPIDAGEGKRWAPIWQMSDEFWRSELHDIWEPFNRDWAGRHPSFFRPENVVVKKNRLQLWAREDQPTDQALINAGYRDFSTAFLRTKHRQKYGYFEIFAKLMDSDISSAFWLAHNEPDGRDSWWTEIDVFEYSTSKKHVDQSTLLNTNVHVHRNGQWKDAPVVTRPESFDTGEDLSKAPHHFALDWTEHDITWYLDGEVIRKIPNLFHHRPLHLQFDSETFPNWFGVPDTGGSHRNKLPNAFEIFYVRSWERVSL